MTEEASAPVRFRYSPRWRGLPGRYFLIGKLIGASCQVIGWFMPYFFADKLESGNVCEYFVMLRQFHALGIREHDAVLYEMGMKEKEHELYFLEQVRTSRLLPIFERVFAWGWKSSRNDVDFDAKYAIPDAERYCAHHPGAAGGRNGDRERCARRQ